MSDFFKRPGDLANRPNVRNSSAKNVRGLLHASDQDVAVGKSPRTVGMVTPGEVTGQDVVGNVSSVRRSLRNVGKDSVVRRLNMAPQTIYPDSASKPHGNRFLRTPKQTIPQRIGDGTEQSVSKSSDQEDIITPRSNIEALLATADTEPRTLHTSEEVLQKTVAKVPGNTIMKTPEQSDRLAMKKLSVSVFDLATPGNKLTPRTNIRNLLNFAEDEEQIPTVGTGNHSKQASTKTRVSGIQHSNWGQEVNLSPMYHTHASEDMEFSPVSLKAMKRNRQSFHIPVPQLVLAPQNISEQTVLNEKQMTTQSDTFDAAKDFPESLPPLSKKPKTSISSEDIRCNTADVAESTPVVAENIVYFADNILNVIEEPEVIISTVAYEENGQNNFLGAFEVQENNAMSRLSRHESTVVAIEVDDNVNDSRHMGSGSQVQTNQDIAEEELGNVGSIQNPDVDSYNRIDGNNTGTQVGESAEDNVGELQEDRKKDKNFGGNRTSVTRKHGEISFTTTPKKNPTSQQGTPTVNASIYDLNDASSTSSGDIEVPSRRNKSQSHRKGRPSGSSSSQIVRSPSKRTNVTGSSKEGSHSSVKGSKLSYSEWKSLQKETNSPGQTNSFLNIPPQCSSTPFDRKRRMLHSTRIQNSLAARGSDDQMSDSIMTGPVSGISPIRPDISQRQKGTTGSRYEMTDMDQDGGCDGGHKTGNINQGIGQVEDEFDDDDDDLIGFSPLTTPHIDMGKRMQVSSVGQKLARRQFADKGASGSAQKRKKDTADVARQPEKRRQTASKLTALPRKSVKFFAERHSTMKLSKDAVEMVEEASERFWDDTFLALEAYALHAGRKIISEQDVILLMRTLRLVTDTEDLHDKIREFLPMELRSELIPMAKP